MQIINNEKNKLRGNLFILLAAFTWGVSIVWQKEGMDYMQPFSFTGVRFVLGGICLFIVSLILDYINNKKGHSIIEDFKKALKPGLICAPIILATVIVQQYALKETEVGKSAFICAFYIFLVPVFSFFFGEKPSKKVWFAVILATIGMFVMNMSEGIENINRGDALSFIVAIGYAAYIILGDKYSKKVDPVKYATIQFLIAGILSLIISPFVNPGDLCIANIKLSMEALIVTAIFSTCMGYTLQLIGQKDASANEVPIILSSETLFSLIAGFVILHEVLKINEYIGCALIAIAIIISVLPERKNIFEKFIDKFIKKKGDNHAIRNF